MVRRRSSLQGKVKKTTEDSWSGSEHDDERRQAQNLVVADDDDEEEGEERGNSRGLEDQYTLKLASTIAVKSEIFCLAFSDDGR